MIKNIKKILQTRFSIANQKNLWMSLK